MCRESMTSYVALPTKMTTANPLLCVAGPPTDVSHSEGKDDPVSRFDRFIRSWSNAQLDRASYDIYIYVYIYVFHPTHFKKSLKPFNISFLYIYLSRETKKNFQAWKA